jgi:aminomethyltransferase
VAWLGEHVGSFDVVVEDVSAEWAQIALQGPEAEGILQTIVGEDLAGMKYYGFVWAELGGGECIVSRTGYTGEDGFEIYGPPATAEPVWKSLVEAGSGRGLVPVGLGARDTLRLEAKMALYGNDIDDTTTVIEADLGWIVKLKKGEFIGRDVLAKQKSEGVEQKLVGFEMRARAIARHGYPAMRNGEAVGRVTSGTRAPFLQRNIGLAYLPRGLWDPGAEFDVDIRGRAEPAVVVPTPFYKRER